MAANRWKFVWVAVALLVASAVGVTIYAVRTATSSANAGGAGVITSPKRRPVAEAQGGAPELPANAHAIAPMTLVVALRQDGALGPGAPVRQTITRTADRIHVKADQRREWLFERNPIDLRRVTAVLVDHTSQTIVLYDESDLLITRHIRGWADALTLGFDEQRLGSYAPTKESRTVGVLLFVRYDEPGEPAAGPVWWNHEQAIASDFAITDAAGRTQVSVERAAGGVDRTLLLPPTHRFPTYRVLDLADWLEKH